MADNLVKLYGQFFNLIAEYTTPHPRQVNRLGRVLDAVLVVGEEFPQFGILRSSNPGEDGL